MMQKANHSRYLIHYFAYKFDSSVCCLQRVLYFPLKPRLKALLKCKKYRKMCQHEFVRPKPDDGLIADVYDCSAWKEFMGPVSYPVQRYGFQYCIDGMPSNAEGSHSVKPGGLSNFSLPPTERFKRENMLLMVVIPTAIKDPGVKKYYDFMATYELNDLFYNGVGGVKMKIFSTSMDTPGRSELMGESCRMHVVCIFFIIFSLDYFLTRYGECSRVSSLPGVSAHLEFR